MPLQVSMYVEDVGGSFKRFVEETPRIARAYLHEAVEKTAFSMMQRMKANVEVGPDAPHVRDYLTYKRRGQRAEIGILEASGGGDPAAEGSTASIADVAIFNEYRPNRQPFMRPAAEAESADFARRISDAVKQVERDLSGGGGLL